MQVVKEVGTYEAKTHFSKLLEEVQAGTKIIVTRHGKPVAEIQTPSTKKKKARFGCAKSPNFYMADDFDAPLEEFREYM
ncbi:MAG: type II toxin-antitoxin system Phd/YefM family antitoxin [Verrucomicrobia bacterium]|nr:type II toxin-antitoxin system Phd/YefM family antitoxin [Verrucomicrobiota bacterium]MCH8514300.1 type II toxin-antitoxin system prevent-host-death family antitoxin [Kiritimatiellia bacterium]